jgi:hypothetical protein
MKPLATALLAALAAGLSACGSPSGAKVQPAAPDTAKAVAAKGGDIDSWGDADKFIGQRISLVGRLGSVRGVHGTITTRGGLVVGLPNLDLHAPGVGWYDWLDRSVEVTGVLHAPGARPGGMKDFGGPTLEVEPDSFHGID